MPLQQSLFLPKPEWTPPKLSELPSWGDASRVCIDVETYDPQLGDLGPGVRRGGYIVGYAVGIEDGPSMYLPVAHQGGDNLDRDHVRAYMRDNAAKFSGTLVNTNLAYDLDFMAEEKITFPKTKWFRDVLNAAPLLNELEMKYSLDTVAKRLGFEGKDTSLMEDAVRAFGLKGKIQSHIWKLPARYVKAYAEGDVMLPLKVMRRQEREIEEQEIQGIWDLESKLLPVLVKMRRKGVRVDFDKLDQIEARLLAEETKHLNEIHRLTGHRIPVGSVWQTDLLAAMLCSIRHAPPPGNNKPGSYSVTNEWLRVVDDPAAKCLLEAREVNKIRTTFVKSIREHAVNGRIHCTFHQLKREKEDGEDGGAAFGRLSSSDPNLQQQPARHPVWGKLWRSIYIPEEGGLWAAMDYSQQEPRILTHYAEITNCQGASLAGDRYRNDPTTDNHQMMADLTGLPRRQAKDMFLGKCYGMGSAKLAKKLGLPTKWIYSKRFKTEIEVADEEGQAIIEQFNQRAPYVAQLSKLCEQRAAERGYLITLLGRRCRFPLKEGSDHEYDWTFKALNRLIQGGAADQTKAALLACDEAGHEIALQVHDELDTTVRDRQHAEEIATIMREVVPLTVPSKVDVEIGPNWGEAK